MDSEAEMYDVCKRVCFAASAMGYNAIEEEKDPMTKVMFRYAFQSAIGNKIEGEWCDNRKQALFSVCKKFDEQVKPNGQ